MVNKTKYNLFIILILILLISSTIIYAAYVNQEIIDGGGSGSAKLETDKLNGIEESGVIKLDEELNIGHEGFSSNTSIELDNYIFNDEYLLNDGRGYGPGRYGAYTFYSISRDGFIPRSEEKYYKNRMTYSKLAELQNLNGQTVNSHSLSNYTVYSTGSTSASFNTYEYWIHSSGTTHYGKNSGTYLYRSYPVIEYGMGTKIDLCGDLDREKIALSYFLTSDTTWSQKQEAVFESKESGGNGLDENKYKEAYDYADFYLNTIDSIGGKNVPNMDPKLDGGGIAVSGGKMLVGPFKVEYNQAISDNWVFGGISNMYLKGYYEESYYYDDDGDDETPNILVHNSRQLVNERIDLNDDGYGYIQLFSGSKSGVKSLNFFTPNNYLVDETAQQSYPQSGETFYVQLDQIPKGDIPYKIDDPNDPNYGKTKMVSRVTYLTLCVEFKWCNLKNVGVDKIQAKQKDVTVGADDGYGKSGWWYMYDCKCGCKEEEEGEEHKDCKCVNCGWKYSYGYSREARYQVSSTEYCYDLWNFYGGRELYGTVLECGKWINPLCMTLGGYVWEDAEVGKESVGDGLYDRLTGQSSLDKPIQGIKVTLQRQNANGTFTNVSSKTTNSSGKYTFTSLNPLYKYRVVFEYNGQIYMPTDYLKTGTTTGDQTGEPLHATSALENYNNQINWKINSKALETISDRNSYNQARETISSSNNTTYKNTQSNIGTNITDNGTYISVTSTDSNNIMKAYTQNFNGTPDVFPVYDDFQVSGNFLDEQKDIVIADQTTASTDPETGVTVFTSTSTTTNNLNDGLHNYINLGLCRRPSEDAAIRKDLYKAAIKINGHTEVYNYKRNIDQNKDYWEIRTRLEDANYYGEGYDRKMYESDIYYENSDKSKELKMFVTYKITVRNQSEIVLTEIKEIVDYYHSSYTLREDLSWVTLNSSKSNITSEDFYDMIDKAPETPGSSSINAKSSSAYAEHSLNGYKKVYINDLQGKKLGVGEEAYIFLTFEIDKNTITPSSTWERTNIAEINAYSTYYPDKMKMPNGLLVDEANNNITRTIYYNNNNTVVNTVRNNVIAGLVDVDSNPGNFTRINESNYEQYFEDDTDRSKGIKIYIESGLKRQINGTVWEDKRNLEVQGAIIGNGILDSRESGFKGVKVELYEVIFENGKAKVKDSPAQVYNNGWAEYNFTTDSSGNYNISGYVPGNYIIRFTYPNGQDYKSTIYQAELDQLGTDNRQDEISIEGYKDYENQNISASYGYNIKEADSNNRRVSDAKDIWEYRENTNKYASNNGNGVEYNLAEELTNAQNDKTKMVAETGIIRVEVEYNTEITDENPNNYNIKNVDFGITERPKASLELDKKVSNLKIVLSDQRVLFDTTQSASNLIWTPKTGNHGGLIQAIIDEELMYGANIKITYKFEVKNTGEIDYKDKVFYYTGKESNPQANIVKTSADSVVDYVSNNLQFRSEDSGGNWIVNKNINVKQSVKNKFNNYNTIITTDNLKGKLIPTEALGNGIIGNTSKTLDLVLSHSITSADSTVYENIAEIIKVSNDVGRRMETENGEAILQGNQDPESDPAEQDSSKAENISIIPPYGEAHLYFGLGITILVLVIAGVIIIKKKVLKK